ncbi:hypothetical protein C8Q75DRAFT_426449 [Abortiporus biennis]|nr:hypothetical protein C8Q75DRAFT_426449 [Abortiporus biennis]
MASLVQYVPEALVETAPVETIPTVEAAPSVDEEETRLPETVPIIEEPEPEALTNEVSTEVEAPTEEAPAEVAIESVEEAAAPVVEVGEVEPTEAVAAEEAKPATWPVSYSVSSQGTSPLSAPQVTEDAEVTPIEHISATPAGETTVPPIEEFIPEAEPEVALKIAEPAVEVAEEPAEPEVAHEVAAEVSEVEAEAKPEAEPQVIEEHIIVPAVQVDDTTTEVVDSDAQNPAETESHPERPWTPSYSVTQQGTSPLLSTQQLPEEPVAEEQSEERAVEETRPERPWTPSYTVTRQGSNAELATQYKEQEPEAVEVAPVVEEVPNAEPVEETPAHEESVTVVPEAVVVTSEDHTESSQPGWTPSYSVSQQGTSPLATPAVETKELQDVAPQVTEEPEHVEPSQLEIKLETVETEEPAELAATTEERPERPWTPSYSVTRQGSTTLSDSAEDKLEVHAFPTNEASDAAPKLSEKPSSLRLAPLNEDEQVDSTSPVAIDTLSPTSAGGRTRLESTTSSRFFPGGWFSTPKSPDDNRTSLDHANGEFTPLNTVADAVTPTLEVPANSPIDGVHEDRKRSRWCVIM